jgi:hypothetical protein
MDQVVGIVVGFLVSIFVVLMVREVVTWYWKINESIEQRREILVELRFIRESLNSSASNSSDDEVA